MSEITPLPEPDVDFDFPLMKALERRRTIRKWSDAEISTQDIANLLWAACGITQRGTRRIKSKRTAPSACNSQEIRVYLIDKNGVFLYDEERHGLVERSDRDLRSIIGTQKMMTKAPIGLVFVADLSRMTARALQNDEAQRFSAWVDTGYISQNVYLYCAAANLGTAALAWIDRDSLSKEMGLAEHEKIVLTQVVGYIDT